MFDDTASTIASLLFATRPPFNFAAQVSEIDADLRAAAPQTYSLLWDEDEFVAFHMNGLRIVLAYCDKLAEPGDAENPGASLGACLIVSIGPQPGRANRNGPETAHVIRRIVTRLEQCLPLDRVLWSTIDHAFTHEDIEPVLATASWSLNANVIAGRPRFPKPDEVRLMQQFDTQIAANAVLPVAPDTPPEETIMTGHSDQTPGSIANDLPDLPHPMVSQAERIRAALYPDAPEPAKMARARAPWAKAPLPQRLTIYTMNTTLMLVALPVGAAILAYSVVRGENLNCSARAIALAGTAVGLAQSPLGLHLLGLA